MKHFLIIFSDNSIARVNAISNLHLSAKLRQIYSGKQFSWILETE